MSDIAPYLSALPSLGILSITYKIIFKLRRNLRIGQDRKPN